MADISLIKKPHLLSICTALSLIDMEVAPVATDYFIQQTTLLLKFEYVKPFHHFAVEAEVEYDR